MFPSKEKNQYLATFFGKKFNPKYFTYVYLLIICIPVCLQKVSAGSLLLWISPALLELTSVSHPLLSTGPISFNQTSWLLTSLVFGEISGTFFFAGVVDKLGRKSCLLLTAFGQIISIFLFLVPENLLILCISQFILGFFECGATMIHNMFVREIADDRIRGRLGTSFFVSLCCGFCSVLILANYFNYYVYTGAFIGFPILSFLLIFFVIPDSPQGLMARNRVAEAEKSLQFYRNDKNYQISQWTYSDEKKERKVNSIRKELKSKSIRKALLIGTVMVIFNEFNGVFILTAFSGIIFRDTGSAISPNLSSLIPCVLNLVGSMLSTALVDRLGRKALLVFSGIVMALGNTGLGVYMFCQQELLMDLSSYAWTPVIFYCIMMFAASCGIITIFGMIIQEMFPAGVSVAKFVKKFILICFFRFQFSKVANVYLCVMGCLLYTFSANMFPMLSDAFGMHYCVFFFAICSFGGALFCIFVLPETKGKSLEDIEVSMK